MTLLPADYVLLAIAVVLAITGLFRGFSGTIAFVAAAAAAGAIGTFGWSYSTSFTGVLWMRIVGTLVAALLTFGIVRLIVKKIVNGLLAQPTDALLGLILGALCAAALIVAWAVSGMYFEYSALVQRVAVYL